MRHSSSEPCAPNLSIEPKPKLFTKEKFHAAKVMHKRLRAVDRGHSSPLMNNFGTTISAPALCAFRLVRSKCCLIDRMLRGYPERNPWRATASRSLSRQFIAHANRDVVRKHDERISPYGDVASVFVVKKLLAKKRYIPKNMSQCASLNFQA